MPQKIAQPWWFARKVSICWVDKARFATLKGFIREDENIKKGLHLSAPPIEQLLCKTQ